jgi:hypothetical protein
MASVYTAMLTDGHLRRFLGTKRVALEPYADKGM